MNASALLRNDHRRLEHLLGMYSRSPKRPAAAKWALFDLIDRVIRLDQELQDQRFFPLVERMVDQGVRLDEVRAEHAVIQKLLMELRRTAVGPHFDQLMHELDRLVRGHHRSEEALLDAVERTLEADGLERLGAALQAQKSVLANRLHIATSGAPD